MFRIFIDNTRKLLFDFSGLIMAGGYFLKMCVEEFRGKWF